MELAKEARGEQPVVEPEPPQSERETIVVLDFGSQYSMLIARRIRECNVYCELVPYDTPWEKIASLNPR
ncbi:MAG: GMP synthase (glutamine-hydrolyzing), partial [Dehalococcoidia bacterium]|nr:GMP synthase (glutamine-hydrolyzing) [Dehalococcoidia bacterium]